MVFGANAVRFPIPIYGAMIVLIRLAAALCMTMCVDDVFEVCDFMTTTAGPSDVLVRVLMVRAWSLLLGTAFVTRMMSWFIARLEGTRMSFLIELLIFVIDAFSRCEFLASAGSMRLDAVLLVRVQMLIMSLGR